MLELNACHIHIRDISYTGTVSLVFIDDTCTLYTRLFGCHSQCSEGATYWSNASLGPRLLRLKRHLHVATVASPGASCDGTMAFSCGVIGQLEKGCLGLTIVRGVKKKVGGNYLKWGLEA